MNHEKFFLLESFIDRFSKDLTTGQMFADVLTELFRVDLLVWLHLRFLVVSMRVYGGVVL